MPIDVACPYCGGPSTDYLAAPDINRKVSQTVFHLRKCGGCGLIFLADPPDDLGPYYTSDYHYIPQNRAALEPHLPPQRFKIDLLSRYCQSGRLLEIGPSIGQFCALAQRAGFAVSAIEMDPACVRFLRDEVGVVTTQSADPAEVLHAQPETYDAICLWHALEHLPKPWETLEAATARLNPNGVLLVAAPNPLGWQAKFMGAGWPHHDLPRHLFGLSMPWLTQWAAKNGLEVALATTRDEGSLFWNRFSWAMKATGLRRGSKPGGWLWRIGLRLGWLMWPMEGREGQGACYTMVLRRPAAVG
jgi:2-polyprenyl-3-methyl-5-hydroxy-6-metoxy-1,4-benzoquinol methylase